MKKIGIYMITFPSGNRYVGQSVDIVNRLKQHKKKSETYKNDMYLEMNTLLKK